MNGEELQFLPATGAGEPSVPIAYRFHEGSKSRPTYVWFCGFKSEMQSMKANALAGWAREHDAGCLRFDYSGHGQSGGQFEDGTIGAWLAQAAAVCRQVLRGPAVLVGSSMGGWIALLLARGLLPELGQLKGIVLIAPAWDMTRLLWERAPEEAREALLREGVYDRPSSYGDGPYAITKTLIDEGENHCFGPGPVPLGVPIRILHGCLDEDIPWRRSLALFDIVDCPDMRLTLVKDAGHRLSRPADLDLLFASLSEFL
jgi:pimeloyl-ACP methyl ester carboxylesterase